MSDDGENFAAMMRRQAMAREAAASVSLSHREGCDCTICKAAKGDEAAFAQVLELLQDMDDQARGA